MHCSVSGLVSCALKSVLEHAHREMFQKGWTGENGSFVFSFAQPLPSAFQCLM